MTTYYRSMSILLKAVFASVVLTGITWAEDIKIKISFMPYEHTNKTIKYEMSLETANNQSFVDIDIANASFRKGLETFIQTAGSTKNGKIVFSEQIYNECKDLIEKMTDGACDAIRNHLIEKKTKGINTSSSKDEVKEHLVKALTIFFDVVRAQMKPFLPPTSLLTFEDSDVKSLEKTLKRLDKNAESESALKTLDTLGAKLSKNCFLPPMDIHNSYNSPSFYVKAARAIYSALGVLGKSFGFTVKKLDDTYYDQLSGKFSATFNKINWSYIVAGAAIGGVAVGAWGASKYYGGVPSPAAAPMPSIKPQVLSAPPATSQPTGGIFSSFFGGLKTPSSN